MVNCLKRQKYKLIDSFLSIQDKYSAWKYVLKFKSLLLLCIFMQRQL